MAAEEDDQGVYMSEEEMEELRRVFEEARRYCCTLCFSLATQPKALECGHIACALCVGDRARDGQVTCLECHHTTLLGALGILSLKDDRASAECVRRIRDSRDNFLLQVLAHFSFLRSLLLCLALNFFFIC